MKRSTLALCFWAAVLAGLLASGQTTANLLRNGDFQDDWIALLPENKTLHWCCPDFFTGRRVRHRLWRRSGGAARLRIGLAVVRGRGNTATPNWMYR